MHELARKLIQVEISKTFKQELSSTSIAVIYLFWLIHNGQYLIQQGCCFTTITLILLFLIPLDTILGDAWSVSLQSGYGRVRRSPTAMGYPGTPNPWTCDKTSLPTFKGTVFLLSKSSEYGSVRISLTAKECHSITAVARHYVQFLQVVSILLLMTELSQ